MNNPCRSLHRRYTYFPQTQLVKIDYIYDTTCKDRHSCIYTVKIDTVMMLADLIMVRGLLAQTGQQLGLSLL